ncbi:MAG: hypothetical protein ABL958_16215 [Bdellovibrionia bacterium]
MDYLGEVGRESECLELAKSFVERGWIADDGMLAHFSNCARSSIRENTPARIEWSTVLRRMKGGGAVDVPNEQSGMTAKNYRAIHALLSERKILHIAMQYPTLPVDLIKPMFTEHSPFFAENFVNFEAELARRPFEELFTDRFGGTFGHTTYLGHSLIADTAAAAVLQVHKLIAGKK